MNAFADAARAETGRAEIVAGPGQRQGHRRLAAHRMPYQIDTSPQIRDQPRQIVGKRGAHLLLQTRTRTLDGTLRPLFERWYPGLANDNENETAQADAA